MTAEKEKWRATRKQGPQRDDPVQKRRKPKTGFGTSKDLHEDRGRRQTKLGRR